MLELHLKHEGLVEIPQENHRRLWGHVEWVQGAEECLAARLSALGDKHLKLRRASEWAVTFSMSR